jgi:hypothetical protein
MEEKHRKEEQEETSLYEKWQEQMKVIQNKTVVPGNYVMIGLLASIIFVSIGFLVDL